MSVELNMIEIDGSHGEGGGQILRTAIALSMIEGEEVKINNIRANRPNPGLSHQHLMAVKAAKEISDAEVEGLKKGSTTVRFDPVEVKTGDYEFDIKTAGSITLLLQALLPALTVSDGSVHLRIRGGTDVKWSPPFDYFKFVLLPVLERMGCRIETELLKRGHYPKGGGELRLKVKPGQPEGYPVEEGRITKIKGRAFTTDLPDHISERMKASAEKNLSGFSTDIETKSYSSRSAGTGITLWTADGKRLGAGVLGEKGVPAEDVGYEASEKLLKEIDSGASLDIWAADQIIPFLVLSRGSGEVKVRKETGHLKTNIWVANQFVSGDERIELERNGDLFSLLY